MEKKLINRIFIHLFFCLFHRDVGKEILCCKYNEEFNYLAAGCSDGSIMLYSVDSSKLVHKLQDEELVQATAPVTAIQHRPVSKSYPISNCFTCSCMYTNFPKNTIILSKIIRPAPLELSWHNQKFTKYT